ncbi:hypothetical protein JW805_09010 [Roseomonas aeriglobus]|nr:hypothetical protein [Roseomonas aeriglobus]
MQFLKTLLIVFTVGLAVAFAFNNWASVDIRLWGGLIVDINKPLLMLVCFLLGLIPTWLWQRAIRWRLAQRLAVSERTVADLRVAVTTPPTTTPPAPTTPALAIPPADGDPLPPVTVEEPKL